MNMMRPQPRTKKGILRYECRPTQTSLGGHRSQTGSRCQAQSTNRNRVNAEDRENTAAAFDDCSGVEAVGALAVILWLGNFIFNHSGEPRFAWPAVLLQVWIIASIATTIRQFVFVSTIHYDQPVLAIQKQIESLRLLRLRVIRFALVTGLIVWWLPFLVVAFKSFFDLDAYRLFGERFFYMNGLASGIIVPLLVWLSRFSQRMARSPFLHNLARHVEGNYIATAQASMATISAFEDEAAA